MRTLTLLTALAFLAASCGDDATTSTPDGGAATWSVVQEHLPGAILSVWGAGAGDVWLVGADARDGTGPMVLRYDGSAWKRVETGQTQGDLWWVFGFSGGPIYMGGAGGVILRYQEGTFTPMATPSAGTVFGIWGASPEDVWAVGGLSDGQSGFAWRLQGATWTPEPSLPASVAAGAAVWKVFGRSADDAWLVGSNGVAFHWDGASLTQGDTGVGSSLFTVHANAQRYAAVGGFGNGILVENEGSGWILKTPEPAPTGLTGVVLGAEDAGYAVGQYGGIYARDAAGWHQEDAGLSVENDLHSVWLDPDGGVWAVGGQTASFPLTDGLVLHKGTPVAKGGL